MGQKFIYLLAQSGGEEQAFASLQALTESMTAECVGMEDGSYCARDREWHVRVIELVG